MFNLFVRQLGRKFASRVLLSRIFYPINIFFYFKNIMLSLFRVGWRGNGEQNIRGVRINIWDMIIRPSRYYKIIFAFSCTLSQLYYQLWRITWLNMMKNYRFQPLVNNKVNFGTLYCEICTDQVEEFYHVNLNLASNHVKCEKTFFCLSDTWKWLDNCFLKNKDKFN